MLKSQILVKKNLRYLTRIILLTPKCSYHILHLDEQVTILKVLFNDHQPTTWVNFTIWSNVWNVETSFSFMSHRWVLNGHTFEFHFCTRWNYAYKLQVYLTSFYIFPAEKWLFECCCLCFSFHLIISWVSLRPFQESGWDQKV